MSEAPEIGKSFAVVGVTSVLTALIAAGWIALRIPAYILHGWVVMTLWGWFVVPTFHLPAISIPLAIGLEMLVILLRPILPPADYKISKMIVYAYVSPLTVFAVAYIAKLYL